MFYDTGFHEAIGDTMALAVVTPKHLEKLGLTEPVEKFNANDGIRLINGMEISKTDISYLMRNALQKVSFL